MRNLVWQSEAWSEYVELQQVDKILLKGDLSGFASVRMDQLIPFLIKFRRRRGGWELSCFAVFEQANFLSRPGRFRLSGGKYIEYRARNQ